MPSSDAHVPVPSSFQGAAIHSQPDGSRRAPQIRRGHAFAWADDSRSAPPKASIVPLVYRENNTRLYPGDGFSKASGVLGHLDRRFWSLPRFGYSSCPSTRNAASWQGPRMRTRPSIESLMRCSRIRTLTGPLLWLSLAPGSMMLAALQVRGNHDASLWTHQNLFLRNPVIPI